MDIMRNSSSLIGEDNTKLLFYDSYKYDKASYNVEEIFFGKPVILHQIRIIKAESNPHPKIKGMQSITQLNPIYNFEIFGRNLKRVSDHFEVLFENATINENNGNSDLIFPFHKEFVTNHLIIRGMFEKITLCIYGISIMGPECFMLVENSRNDVLLDRINIEEKNDLQGLNISEDELKKVLLVPIEKLVEPYIKCTITEDIQKAYNINPPNLSMMERTRIEYVNYENDLNHYCTYLCTFYENSVQKKKFSEDAENYVNAFIKLIDIIKKLTKKNFAFLENDCIFSLDNYYVFKKIPEQIVNIVINSTKGNIFGFTEIKYGLKLLKMISNSPSLVESFVDKGGFEALYNLILNKDNSNLITKVLILENIYRLITHKKAFEKFLDSNLDRNKFSQNYFMVKEGKREIIESEINVKKKEKSEKKKSKKKSKKKDKYEKSSNYDSSSSDDNSTIKKKRKKNILLKNGYQIMLTLIIGKKCHFLINIIKKILNKTSFLLYLRELGNFVNYMNNESKSSNICKVYLDKVLIFMEKIYEYLQKLDIDYHKMNENDLDNLFSHDYPYRTFWVDYVKINKKFYKKIDNFNLKSTLESESNSTNKISEFKVISNELAIMLEESFFLQNLMLILSDEKLKTFKLFPELSILSKSLMTFILLSKGGINFYSKNFSNTKIIFNFLEKMTESLPKNEYYKEDNFLIVRNIGNNNNIFLSKSLLEHPIESTLHKILIKIDPNMEINNDILIKSHFIQLKYLLELSFMFLTKLDDFIGFEDEDTYYLDKSLDILFFFSKDISKSNLSKQAFLNIFQNEYFIQKILHFLNIIYEKETLEYEAHLLLVIEIVYIIYTDISYISDTILLIYGYNIYQILNKIKEKFIRLLDETESDTLSKDFFKTFDSVLNFLNPTKIITNEKEVKGLMSFINDCCFNNIQKYNLNEKPINEETIKDQSFKEYVKEMKLNILNYQNNDVDFLDTIKSHKSLINELFVAVKLINLSIRINPLLLIDYVAEHLHLALRYLIVNTVHSVKILLSNDSKNYHETKCEIDKYSRTKEYIIFLYHLLDILFLLLRYLLSSHVDNYRDDLVIESVVYLIISLINNFYDYYNYSDINNKSIYLSELLQKLFEKSLECFKEICKFNTTIKLNFEKIFEKLSENPSNKGSMLYLLSFIFNVVSNEYTLETFQDILKKVQKKPVIDIYYDLESNIKSNIRIGNLSEDNNFLQYVIKVGINSNNMWLINNCVLFLNSVQKSREDNSSSKEKGHHDKIHDKVNEYLKESLENAWNRISKVKTYLLIEEKEIEGYLPNLEYLQRNIRFINYFLKTEYKFILIFNDIQSVYIKIMESLLEFLNKVIIKRENYEKTNLSKLLKKRILETIELIFDAFLIMVNYKEGFSKYVFEEFGSYYELVEEIPMKHDLVKIIKIVKGFTDIKLDSVEGFFNKKTKTDNNHNNEMDVNNNNHEVYVSHHDSISLKKYSIFIKKSLDILSVLLQNILGQNLILYSDYHHSIPRNSKPIIHLNFLIKLIINLLNYYTNFNEFYYHILEIYESFASVIVNSFYDIVYYENSQNVITHENIFTSIWCKNKKIIVTEIRLNNILIMLLGENTIIDASSMKAAQDTIKELEKTVNNSEYIFEKSFVPEGISHTKTKIRNKFQSVKNCLTTLINCFNMSDLVIVPTQNSNDYLKNPKLPILRKIPEKCEIIRKYYNFYCSQNYGNNLPIQTKSELKNQIFEFEKLLNWKKYRILLGKMDYIVIRTSQFDLDNNLKFTKGQGTKPELPSEILANTNYSKKKQYYVNNESFEQFCNMFMNEDLTVYKFANISYFIYFSKVNNNPQLVELFDHKYNLEFSMISQTKHKMDKTASSVKSLFNFNLERKINSKMNTFIYKPKYEKQPKINNAIISNQPSSIRESKFVSIVSGRILSEHVDKFAPNQPIVNTNYVDSQQAQQNLNPATTNIPNNPPITTAVEAQIQPEQIIPDQQMAENIINQDVTNIVASTTNNQLNNMNKVVTGNLGNMGPITNQPFTAHHPMMLQQNRLGFQGQDGNLLPNNSLLPPNNMMMNNMMNPHIPPNLLPNQNFSGNTSMMNMMGGDKNVRQNFPLHQFPPFPNQTNTMNLPNMMNNNMNFNPNILPQNTNPNFVNPGFNQIRNIFPMNNNNFSNMNNNPQFVNKPTFPNDQILTGNNINQPTGNMNPQNTGGFNLQTNPNNQNQGFTNIGNSTTGPTTEVKSKAIMEDLVKMIKIISSANQLNSNTNQNREDNKQITGDNTNNQNRLQNLLSNLNPNMINAYQNLMNNIQNNNSANNNNNNNNSKDPRTRKKK